MRGILEIMVEYESELDDTRSKPGEGELDWRLWERLNRN